MDRVRVLKWVEHTPHWTCQTNVGRYYLNSSGSLAGYDVHRGPTYLGFFPTAQLAMDAAESDYLDRISEFVPVLKPGQVGVDRKLVEALIDALPKGCNRSFDGDCIDDCGMGCLSLKLQSILDSTPTPDAETGGKS